MAITATKFTPGPWEVGNNGSYVNVATGSFIHPHEPRSPTPAELDELGDECHDDWRVCDCEGSTFSRSTAECAANARLIAASPKMFEVLASALEFLSNGTPIHPGSILDQEIRAVLDEAAGK